MSYEREPKGISAPYGSYQHPVLPSGRIERVFLLGLSSLLAGAVAFSGATAPDILDRLATPEGSEGSLQLPVPAPLPSPGADLFSTQQPNTLTQSLHP